MKVDYFGAFVSKGGTVDGPQNNKKALGDLFDFKACVEQKDMEEEDDPKCLYLNSVTDFCLRLKQCIRENKEHFPVTIGGDHCLAIGSVSASYEEDMALIWIDAHGDSNTPETTVSGRIHGMPVSVLEHMGEKRLLEITEGKIQSGNILFFGLRSLDPLEEKLMEKQGVHEIRMSEIRKKGMKECVEKALKILDGKRLYISLDLDVLDPLEAPGVSIPEADGLHSEELYALLSALFENNEIIGMDLVEYNPLNDTDHKTKKIVRNIKEIIESR